MYVSDQGVGRNHPLFGAVWLQDGGIIANAQNGTTGCGGTLRLDVMNQIKFFDTSPVIVV
jgi:hypothetical protein